MTEIYLSRYNQNGSVEPPETVVQDIVARLRDWPLRESDPLAFTVVFGDAANEIELLRTTVDEFTAALSRAVMALTCKVDDNNRLRELGDAMAYMMRYGGDRGWDDAIDAWQETRRG